MIRLTPADKILWFASGSLVVAALIVLASSRQTSANPTVACKICKPICVALSCDVASASHESCKKENDRKCSMKKRTCGSQSDFQVPNPGYYFSCTGPCQRLEPDPSECADHPYVHTYSSSWKHRFTAGTAGRGMIAYRFTCKIDPSFLGMPGAVSDIDCTPKTVGGYFKAWIDAKVRVAVQGHTAVYWPSELEEKVWTRTRTIQTGGVGAWGEGEEEDPAEVTASVSYPELQCEVADNHVITVQVSIRVSFEQRCHALNNIPGGEAVVQDPIFECLSP